MKSGILILAALLIGFGSVHGADTPVRDDPRSRWTPVTDERWTLQCWAITATARFDISASRRYGRLLKLSPRFIVHQKTLLEVTELIARKRFKAFQTQLSEGGPFETVYYEQGGIYADALETMRLAGAMPDSVYSELPEHDELPFRELNALIRKYVKKARFRPWVRFDRREIRSKVAAILDRYFGKPPATFIFDGHEFKPLEFARRYLPDLQNASGEELYYKPRAPEGFETFEVLSSRTMTMRRTSSNQELVELLGHELSAGQTPVIGYTMIDYMRTQHDGEIGFAVNGVPVPDWKTFDWDDPELLGHYVLALEGEWSSEGKLKRVLVKNTFDLEPRDNFGFHWLEADQFPTLTSVEIVR